MKNITKNIIIIIILLSIYINRPNIILEIVKGIDLWKNSLFPSIFPILIISDFILSTNIIKIISTYLGPIFQKLFKTSKYTSYIFIMSIFSGTPTNAKYILDLYQANIISKEESIKILSMCQLYNPLLILTITPFLNFKDQLFLIICNILINLIVAFINRNYKTNTYNKEFTIQKFNLINSIDKAINIMLLILGSLITFITINALIPIKFPLINGIFEITSGIYSINNYNFYSKYNLLFTSVLLSFGGLSILFQIKSIFKDANLDYSLYYKSRIIHLILFFIFTYIYTLM